MDNGITPVMPVGGGYGDGFGGMSGGLWLFAILALLWGGNGAFGGGNNNANAIQADVNRGFDNQNLQAQTRDILGAVTAGTAQSVAATNQIYHDTVTAFNDKYSELQRDVAGLAVGQANLLAKQNECCCSTLRAIDGVNYNTTAQVQKVLDAMSANTIEVLRARISQLELAQATAGVVRYPNTTVYSAGENPFAGGTTA